MNRWKTDAAAIAQAVDAVCGAGWLPADRRWWPNFVYHSTNITNAANILNQGDLLSRRHVQRLSIGFADCASPEIIGRLPEEDQDWVRLYFRPLAPTQHANEGIRPKALYEFDAHMPVPVYLLFDAKNVLSLDGTLFTKGRLTHDAERGEDAAFLRSIDWRRVLHQGPFTRKDRDPIINARHAEVLVKNSLSLDHLRVVVCRSAPERRTLLGLLEPGARTRWQRKIALERPGRELFYKRGTFVESVELGTDHSRFTLYANILPAFRGPFHVRVRWEGRSWAANWAQENFYVEARPLSFRLGTIPRPSYRVRMELDGLLAFQGDYKQPAGPQVL